VIRDEILVDLGRRALLRAGGRREVPEMIDDQRQVGIQRLADRLAVLPALGDGKHLLVRIDRVRDGVEHLGALGRRLLTPCVLRRVRGVQREFDVLGRGVRNPR
jgi:hypothetical protein